jgi:hypothetical protein
MHCVNKQTNVNIYRCKMPVKCMKSRQAPKVILFIFHETCILWIYPYRNKSAIKLKHHLFVFPHLLLLIVCHISAVNTFAICSWITNQFKPVTPQVTDRDFLFKLMTLFLLELRLEKYCVRNRKFKFCLHFAI